ncbi:hypothetical protein GCM10025868_20110 [Angustibacter aerolatus]|uniref:Uncharacterized protein n=1 Tax=Angustibacter aerolatus TaxID=1162965 RepID=A0ABQ6JGU2_9ACTN|nr:hypothetical protein GCM10025868_20110 [Angustibacter aerolatus]
MWTATVGPAGEPTTVGTGRLTVAAGATERITVRFTIPDCLVRNQISVRLAADRGRSPEVHYWVLPHDSATWKTSGGPSCEA